jgi:crotonobetainyl-CoA:carnitine CoA-transferase CaiB-like acyl-CoA transferase
MILSDFGASVVRVDRVRWKKIQKKIKLNSEKTWKLWKKAK